ncbi:MAG: glutamate--tRNA ligase, partial [Armatimonadetes bacterium]|nr:glutamate--tRNA ligase [Armatimonadota bacterium]
MEDVRVRFAPSPTGSPHIGNIRTAVYDWLLRKRFGGSFIVRIEDTDRTRYVPGSLDELLESLRWLGLDWDEGPEVGGPFGPYFQSERLDIYRKYSQQLLEQGHAYRCLCPPERLAEMRKEQEARKQPTGYDRLCLNLPPEEVAAKLREGIPSVIRFKVPQQGETSFTDVVRGEITFENRQLDDFIIVKSDGYPTYQFANVVDDHLMEITHIIRGEEWISSTPKHVLLYRTFGWTPPVFAHAPLILGPDRSKLGKRHGAVAFLEFKERGFLPEAMINYLMLLGWSAGTDQEMFTIQELIESFSLEGIVNHPVIFDIQKLEWMNGVYIRGCDLDRLTELCLPYLQQACLVPENPAPEDITYARSVVALEQERLKVLSEVVDLTRFFFEDEPEYDEKGVSKWLGQEHAPELLRRLIDRLQGLSDLTHESIEEAVRQVGEEMGLSGG